MLGKRQERTLSSALLGGSGRAIWREVGVSCFGGGKKSGDCIGEGSLRPPNMLSYTKVDEERSEMALTSEL